MTIDSIRPYSGISIIDDQTSYTYQQLVAQIDEYKNQLSNEITNGEVVAIHSDYSFYSIALLLAMSQLPLIIVPIVPTTEAELESKVSAAHIQKIISIDVEGNLDLHNTKEKPEAIEKYKEITDKGQSGLVLFSSGTTGVPKVMVHDLTLLMQSYEVPRKTRKLNFLLFLLFDHIGGVNTLISSLNNGSTLTLPSNRNPEYILQLIQDKKVQILPTSPTFLNLMLYTDNFKDYDLSSLKMITYGTERMPQTLLNKVKDKIPSVRLLQTFGTSETGILKTQSKSSTSLFFKIQDSDYDYKIIDNQLYLKSKNQVKGYVNQNSEQFTEEGWFATGDLVETDEEGYIKIIGRINNVINVGGQKVLPKEVEDVINNVPDVIDATVYGKNNAITGQMVCAEVVIPKESDAAAIKKEIKRKCMSELDKYKVPSKLSIKYEMEYSNRFKKGSKS